MPFVETVHPRIRHRPLLISVSTFLDWQAMGIVGREFGALSAAFVEEVAEVPLSYMDRGVPAGKVMGFGQTNIGGSMRKLTLPVFVQQSGT